MEVAAASEEEEEEWHCRGLGFRRRRRVGVEAGGGWFRVATRAATLACGRSERAITSTQRERKRAMIRPPNRENVPKYPNSFMGEDHEGSNPAARNGRTNHDQRNTLKPRG